MSNEAQYMPFYISDYLADTAHLSTTAHGAYLLLILNYWQRGKPLPGDDRKLAAISRLSSDQWALVSDDLAELFHVTDGEWRHKRVDAELAKARAKIDAAKKAGKASAERRQNKTSSNDERHANDRSTDVQQPSNHKVRLGKEDVAVLGNAREGALIEALGHHAEQKANGRFIAMSEPLRWIAAGCDFDADILPTVRAKATRTAPIRSWEFFTEAVFEARDRRLAPPPPVQQRAASPPSRSNGRQDPFAAMERIAARERQKAEIDSRAVEFVPADRG